MIEFGSQRGGSMKLEAAPASRLGCARIEVKATKDYLTFNVWQQQGEDIVYKSTEFLT